MKYLTQILFAAVTLSICLQASDIKSKSDDLYLVIGSARKELTLNFWSKRLYQSEGQDFSHRSTFSGRATTLDIESANLPNLPHIKADARTFKPQAKIKAVFMELFPSFYETTIGKRVDTYSERDDLRQYEEKMQYMSDALKNIAVSMAPGATLAIEHEPFGFLIPDLENFSIVQQNLVNNNPFNCVISPLYYQVFYAWFLRNNEDEQKKYFNDLGSHLKHNRNLASEHVEYIIDDTHKRLEKVSVALDNIANLLHIDDRNMFESAIKLELQFWMADVSKYDIFSSLTGLVFREIYYLTYQDHIEKYLKNLGFTDVRIGREAVNPYNGRRNSWMISAVMANK